MPKPKTDDVEEIVRLYERSKIALNQLPTAGNSPDMKAKLMAAIEEFHSGFGAYIEALTGKTTQALLDADEETTRETRTSTSSSSTLSSSSC